VHPEPAALETRAGSIRFGEQTMHKKTYSLPNLTPKFSICPNGCIHLHIGPASLHVTAEGLREFRDIAERILATVATNKNPAVAGKDLH
jgi:hypothetical protein